ncbi:MAG TPA: aminopeptidase N, partial [Sphingomonadaceae bacterium]|nr:aminopeptidase N [Sphingomonadaceae bacterium]
MDIVTNPEMADAAETPHAPPVTLRENYRAPAWLVPEIALDFALGLEKTRIRAELQVSANPAAAKDGTIRLNGDGLTPVEVLVDGEALNSWRLEKGDLLVDLPGDAHRLEIVTEIDPSRNTQLMGLYASNGMLCTQCEAEGFRRITFFPDRPDVLSTYRVRMVGEKAAFPVLLSNGNLEASGENGDGTHWAEWHDPWPKPCYLFALVAGDLVANRGRFTTMSGREVELNIWVRPGDL